MKLVMPSVQNAEPLWTTESRRRECHPSLKPPQTQAWMSRQCTAHWPVQAPSVAKGQKDPYDKPPRYSWPLYIVDMDAVNLEARRLDSAVRVVCQMQQESLFLQSCLQELRRMPKDAHETLQQSSAMSINLSDPCPDGFVCWSLSCHQSACHSQSGQDSEMRPVSWYCCIAALSQCKQCRVPIWLADHLPN